MAAQPQMSPGEIFACCGLVSKLMKPKSPGFLWLLTGTVLTTKKLWDHPVWERQEPAFLCISHSFYKAALATPAKPQLQFWAVRDG